MNFRIVCVLIAVFLAGCGGQVQREAGVEPQSLLIIKSEKLLGSRVQIDDTFYRVVKRGDLTPYETGVWGVKDREDEGLDIMTIQVEPGERRIQVSENGRMLIDRKMYFSKGQQRILRVSR